MATKKKTTAAKKPQKVQQVEVGLSYDTKTIITILLLVTVYPVGLVMMFIWMDTWPTWVKVLVSIPAVLFGFVLLTVFMAALSITI